MDRLEARMLSSEAANMFPAFFSCLQGQVRDHYRYCLT